MKTVFLALMFLAAACGSIPEDESTAPIDAGLYSVEMRSSCGLDVGLHGCFYKKGEDLSQKFLSVPVSFKGEFEIVSDRCNFSEKFNFEKIQEVKYSWAELTKNKPENIFACLFSIKVKFDKVRSMLGQFLLSHPEEFEVAKMSFMGKIYEGVASYQLPLEMVNDPELVFENADVVFYEGCGARGEVQGKSLKLSLLAPEKKDCIVEVGSVQGQKVSVGSFNLKFYEKTYVDLPSPILEYDNGKLSVKADAVVMVTSIDNSWKRGNKISKKVSADKTAWVRILTSNGRFKLLGVKNGEIVWTSSKR